jgi:hypothetical protein
MQIQSGDHLLVLRDLVVVPVVAENREKYATVPIRHVGGTRAVVSTRKLMGTMTTKGPRRLADHADVRWTVLNPTGTRNG